LLFETDVLLAALNPRDTLNAPAREVLEQSGLLLSPFSLLELNLLVRAGKLEIPDYGKFALDLDALLAASSIGVLSDRAEFHSEGRRFEREFKLSFFDGLHAAVSKVRRETIVSFDKAYDKLRDSGVARLDPRNL